MNERVAVSQVNSSQLANLVRSHVVKVTKPQSDQAITLDLNDGAGAKLDLSAVANEKMTLVHVDTKLVILFDNQSTVTAEPFFDLSGKPLANLNVELSAGRTLNGEQFAQSVPITDDQSVLPASDPSSGADFRDVFIDSLPGSMSPLALMAQEMPGILGAAAEILMPISALLRMRSSSSARRLRRSSDRLRASSTFQLRAEQAHRCSRLGFWARVGQVENLTVHTLEILRSRPRRVRAQSISLRHCPLPSGGGVMSWVNLSGPTRASRRTCGNSALCVCRSSVSVARRFAEASPMLGFVSTA